MIKRFSSINTFLEKYQKQLYYSVPLLTIMLLLFATNLFFVDKKVINGDSLWDMAGRPYKTFLYELNLPNKMGAIFIGGTADNIVRTEKHYKKVNIGDIFTSQLRSFLFGTKITASSIASYINFMFGVSAIIFSILAGYFIFKNGYISILIFLLIIIFRNFSQGFIYGLPLRHAYAVFNPLVAFCSFILIILYFRDFNKKYLAPLILSGFAIAYISFCRTSEGQIIIAALLLFTALMVIEYLRNNKRDLKKTLINISIMLAAIYIGYTGFYKMIAAFEYHRDKKLNLPPVEEKVLSEQPAFHSLYVSLFRYEMPNRYGDKIGYDAVYDKYPEIKKKFSDDINYVELANSIEYNTAIRELYINYILKNPGSFLTYLSKSIYDYLLFLPYYSWTENKSAHAYLPKINDAAKIEPQDLAPDFKDSSFNWILNLKLKYLPKSRTFWVYFISAYILVFNVIYVSFFRIRKPDKEPEVTDNSLAIDNNLPIYLLWGMLIYFFFTSVVRILIPVHGQSAVVAFNIIIIYNLVRIAVSAGDIKIAKKMAPAWLLLIIVVFLFSLTVKNMYLPQMQERKMNGNFEVDISGWRAHLSILSNADDGQSGKCLQITASENATGYAYSEIPTEIGEMYKITAFSKKGSSLNSQIKAGTAIDATNLYYSGILSDSEWTQYSGIFEATTTVTYVTLVNLTSVKGQTSFFDSVTVVRFENNSKQDNIKR